MTHPTNTDLADALREIANTLPLGSALVVRLAADRLTTGAEECIDPDDGWIVWDGSKYEDGGDELFTPVAKGTLIDVRFRDDELYQSVSAGKSLPDKLRDAAGAFWRNEGEPNDIIAYRVVK